MQAKRPSLRSIFLGATFLSGSVLVMVGPLSHAVAQTCTPACTINLNGSPGGDSGSSDDQGGTGGAGGTGSITNTGPLTDTVISARSNGGSGGAGYNADGFDSASHGGPGGAGGTLTLNNSGTISLSASTTGVAMLAEALGGTGGVGGDANYWNGAQPGGIGGIGGTVVITNTGSITVANTGVAGILGWATGGIGGVGGGGDDGNAPATSATGGAGGTVKINNQGWITTQSADDIAIQAIAIGGAGGAGYSGHGTGGDGGGGGGAAAIGVVSGVSQGNAVTSATAAIVVTNTGALSTTGMNSSGIWAVGTGGAGGAAGKFSSYHGGAGGYGGTVYVSNAVSISTNGQNARAIGAIATGGTGGAGGYYSSTFGGPGGAGGDGGIVTIVTRNSGLETVGQQAQGILGAANGGTGGAGGYGGGDGISDWSGAGGKGGTVVITHTGTIHTNGQYAAAIYATAAGGSAGALSTDTADKNGTDGGKGGTVIVTSNFFELPASYETTAGDQSAGVLLIASGGTGGAGHYGGSGGDGGSATLKTYGQIKTSGQQSYGIQVVVQGGTGGAGLENNALSSTRGAGGAGGNGGTASVTNYAAIMTSGYGAHGIVISTVGGGTGTTSHLVHPTGGGTGGAVSLKSFGAITVTNSGMASGIVVNTSGGTALTPGPAGGGGAITAFVYGSITTSGTAAPPSDNTTQIMSPAISLSANGGNSSDGTNYGYNAHIANGGDGGAIAITLKAANLQLNPNASATPPTLTTYGANSPAIYLTSFGGDGGNANGGIQSTQLNAGGNGGTGGGITVTIGTGASILTHGSFSPGIYAQSFGGNGGYGQGSTTNDYNGGDGGDGGAGGVISIVTSGTIQTQGANSPAILAQSAGGNGGNGGVAADFGGNGGAGGSDAPPTGNGVSVKNYGRLITSGAYSEGIVVSSTGGTGGTGGAGNPGGSGQSGGVGGDAYALNQGSITTSGDSSHGILAVSVGGGGSAGGNTSAAGLIVFANGGEGGGGANAGDISVTNNGSIVTSGANSNGILAFSTGGGGGVGGNVSTLDPAFVLPSVNVTVGGNGGSGAFGGVITVNNTASITTSGFDSAGILAFTAGGAGGKAGSANSSSYSLGFGDIPSINVDVAIGGSGGTGGDGGNVTLTNTGAILTAADQSQGLYAISVGGGGGEGGNATTHIYSYGTSAQVDIGVSIGGSGGNGGSGGVIDLQNTAGTIVTLGFASDAIQAVSIGGGGGNGGVGRGHVDTTIPVVGGYLDYLPLPLGNSYSLTVTLGGAGGGGGDGGKITLFNAANLITLGIDSIGMAAQSIGGSGGNAAAGKATSSATMTLTVGVGGNGGAGGAGGIVSVTNQAGAAIVTSSDGAHGMFGQSIGGGGGTAGTSSADSFDSEASALGSQVVKTLMAKIVQTYLQNFATQQGIRPELEPSVTINVDVGGKGGAGGNGGAVSIFNNGSITTGVSFVGGGDFATGIFAQSIGGGGGNGGAASVSGARIINSNYTIGGNGGAFGAGGAVEVSSSGSITTEGGSAFGVLAQSIGGGGGVGGLATGTAQTELGSSMTLGGSIADNANNGLGSGGGTVTVTLSGLTSSISTFGSEAHGIVAQSIGGGGGLMVINAENYTLIGQQQYQAELLAAFEAYFPIGPYATVEDMAAAFATQAQNATGTISLNFGGSQSSSSQANGMGSGGVVIINHNGQISTAGDNAFGILAQSIGGGGGLATDGPGGAISSLTITGSFGNSGNGGVGQAGGNVTVNLGAGSVIQTTGNGATAILAQSIGGGGGYSGAIDAAGASYAAFLTAGAGFGMAVNANTLGGSVTVQSQGSSTIVTTGSNAHGIFAQSLSGGGGLLANSAGILVPTNAGNSTRGSGFSVASDLTMPLITIVYTGSLYTVGENSIAIFAQSGVQGTSGAIDRTSSTVTSGNINITLNPGTVVGGSGTGAGIVVDGGATNTISIENGTTLLAYSNLAIQSTWGTNLVSNFGTIIGNLEVINTPGNSTSENPNFTNGPQGNYISAANGTINLGTGGLFVNRGTFDVAGIGTISTATLTGTYTQSTSGVLAVDINAAGTQTADLLSVTQISGLNGNLQMNVLGSLLPQQYKVLEQTSSTAPAISTVDLAATNAPGSYVSTTWTMSTSPNGNTLFVTPQVAFTTKGLTANQKAYTDHLQATWNAGGTAALGPVYANFANQPNAASYQAAVNAASPAMLASGPLARMDIARQSLNSVLSCPYFAETGTLLQQGDCTWARVDAGTASYTPSDGAGFSVDTLTYRIGAQKELAPGWFLGASASYNFGWYDASGTAASSDGQGADIAFSVKREIGPWLFSGAVQFGYSTFDASRQNVAGTSYYLSECSYDVYTVGGRFRVEYEILFQSWYIRPYGQVDLIYASVPGFSESGASPYNLTMQKADNFTVAVGPHVEVGGRLDYADGSSLRPFASVGATFFSNASWDVVSSLQNAPAGSGTFTTTVDMPDVVADLGVGIQLNMKGGLDIRLNYEAQIGADYLAHFGGAKLAYRF